MEKQLTPLQAFEDFLVWVHDSGTWDTLDKQQRNRISQAKRDRDGRRGWALGGRRIESILSDYAPGRYEFKEIVILHL